MPRHRRPSRRAGDLSWPHHDLSAHLFVPAPAEDAAMERKPAGLRGGDLHPRDFSRLDHLVDAEVGYGEAVLAIERAELEDHGLAWLQLDDRRRELEALGGDLD